MSRGIEPIEHILLRTTIRILSRHNEFIKTACKSEKITKRSDEAYNHQKLNNKEAAILDYTTFKYSFISKHLFARGLQQIRILKQLGFQPICPKSYEEGEEKGTLATYLLEMAHYYDSNFDFLNQLYAVLMIENWENNQKMLFNILMYQSFLDTIINYYRSHPENRMKFNYLESNINDPDYKTHLKEFMQIRHHSIHFCFKALKVLKSFYPNEFERIKPIKKATKDYCYTTELWKPYNIPNNVNEK